MRSHALLAAAALVATATSAHAGCDLLIQPASDNWRISGYDPFDGKPPVGQFDAVFINRGDAKCSGRIQVDLRGERFGLANAGGPGRVSYTLVDADSQSDLTPRAGVNARRAGSRVIEVAPGARELRRFSLVVDPGDLPGAGDYSQTAFMSVQSEEGLPLGERQLTFGLNVASAAVMGLKGAFTPTAAGGLVQLGELSKGEVPLPLRLYVKSTSGYRVSVSSANAGKLRLGESNWTVPYDLSVGSHAVDLKKGGHVQVMSAAAHNDDYSLAIQIHDVKGRRAGAYSDTVTFTVAAL